jgi:ABC-type glycerol-3-phosphate transport system substrate-binding protein
METYPTGINNNDEVVGYFGDATGAHGFADVGGVFTTIDDPLAIPGTTYAQGVNNSGAITGYFSMGQSVYGFLDVNGVFTTINDPDAVPLPALPEPGLWMLMLAGNGLIASALRRRRAGSARSPSRG